MHKTLNFFLSIILIIVIVVLIIFMVNLLSSNSKPSPYDWFIGKLNIEKSWEVSMGQGITVAIIDSGFSKKLLPLFDEERIIDTYNVFDGSKNVEDAFEHGTKMVSLIGASGDNDLYGVAPRCSFIIIKAINDGGRTSSSVLTEAIYYAANSSANIINISIGSRNYNQEVAEAIEYAIDRNKIIVSAVGDMQESYPLFPASEKSVIGIAAQNQIGTIYKNSNLTQCPILIPGENIKVPTLDGENNLIISTDSGSSYATSIATGIIALILSVDSTKNNLEIKDILLSRKDTTADFLDVEYILKKTLEDKK